MINHRAIIVWAGIIVAGVLIGGSAAAVAEDVDLSPEPSVSSPDNTTLEEWQDDCHAHGGETFYSDDGLCCQLPDGETVAFDGSQEVETDD